MTDHDGGSTDEMLDHGSDRRSRPLAAAVVVLALAATIAAVLLLGQTRSPHEPMPTRAAASSGPVVPDFATLGVQPASEAPANSYPRRCVDGPCSDAPTSRAQRTAVETAIRERLGQVDAVRVSDYRGRHKVLVNRFVTGRVAVGYLVIDVTRDGAALPESSDSSTIVAAVTTGRYRITARLASSGAVSATARAAELRLLRLLAVNPKLPDQAG